MQADKDDPEPISVYPIWYPKGRPNTVSSTYYYSMMILFLMGNIVTMTSLVMILIPSLLIMYCVYPFLPFISAEKGDILKIWCYRRYKSYVQMVLRAWGSWIIIISYLRMPGTMIFYGDANDMKGVAQSIVMSNHQIFPDCKTKN